MEATDHLRTLRGRWPIVVAAVAVASVVAWWTAPAPTPATGQEEVHVSGYTATHTLLQDSQPGARIGPLNVTLLAALAQRGDIPRRVVERLGVDEEPAVVASRVQITDDPKLGMITISASDPDGERAATLANAFGEEILAYAAERTEALRQEAVEATQASLASQRARIEELNAAIGALSPDGQETKLLMVERDALLSAYGRGRGQLEELSTTEGSSGLVTLSAAVPVPVMAGSGSPIQAPRDLSARLRLAILVGLGLGAGLALLLERVDPRIRSRRQAEDAFGLPVLAHVPGRGRTAALLDRWPARAAAGPSAPTGLSRVAYDRLRLDVLRRPRWVLPPPSPDPTARGAGGAHGSSALVVHDPVRVVLVTSSVDGEGRGDTLDQLRSSFRAVGYQVAVIVDGAVDRSCAERIRATRDEADVVLVDGGPLLLASAAAAAIGEVDAVVVVARLGRTSVAAAALAREQLAALQAPVLGVVLRGAAGGTVGTMVIGALARKGTGRSAWHARGPVSAPDVVVARLGEAATAPVEDMSARAPVNEQAEEEFVRPVEQEVPAPRESHQRTSELVPRTWLIDVFERVRTQAAPDQLGDDGLPASSAAIPEPGLRPDDRFHPDPRARHHAAGGEAGTRWLTNGPEASNGHGSVDPASMRRAELDDDMGAPPWHPRD